MRVRRANRRAFWWISNLWYEPHYVFMVLGAIVVILLLVDGGAVRGGACLSGAGCVSWSEQGIVASAREQVVIRAP